MRLDKKNTDVVATKTEKYDNVKILPLSCILWIGLSKLWQNSKIESIQLSH
jgi:hypothetical protein